MENKKHWLDKHIENENKLNGLEVANMIRNCPQISEAEEMEMRSEKAGFYVIGHKNFGDVYEA